MTQWWLLMISWKGISSAFTPFLSLAHSLTFAPPHRSRNLLFDKGSRDEFERRKECCEQHLKYSKKDEGKAVLPRSGFSEMWNTQTFFDYCVYFYRPLHHSYLALIKRLTHTSRPFAFINFTISYWLDSQVCLCVGCRGFSLFSQKSPRKYFFSSAAAVECKWFLYCIMEIFILRIKISLYRQSSYKCDLVHILRQLHGSSNVIAIREREGYEILILPRFLSLPRVLVFTPPLSYIVMYANFMAYRKVQWSLSQKLEREVSRVCKEAWKWWW